MSNQENDQKQQHHHRRNNQENDLKQQQHIQEQPQQQQELQQPEKEEEIELQEQQHNNQTIKNPPPTMSSASPASKLPPTPPSQHQYLDSPPPDSTHSSYGYVFSSPQVLDQSTTYQSPPTDQTASYSYAFSPSSPAIKPAKPPSPSPSPPPAAAASVHVSKTGSKTQDQENGIRKRPVFGRKKDIILKIRTLLGCRVFGFIFCLVSFSIMAADKNQGWAIDSFYRYKEFRYSLSVTVIGFAYSGLQAYDLAYSLATGRIIRGNLRYLLDFSLDQVLTYLLLSASSSAAFRVEDWESNWGKDNFPSMAKSSVVLSFLAFVAFALCSLLSGQILFTPSSAWLM